MQIFDLVRLNLCQDMMTICTIGAPGWGLLCSRENCPAKRKRKSRQERCPSLIDNAQSATRHCNVMMQNFSYSRILLLVVITLGVLAYVSAWPTAAEAHPAGAHMSSDAHVSDGGHDSTDHAERQTSETCCHHDGTCTSKVTLGPHHTSMQLRETSARYPMLADPYRASLIRVTDPPPPRV